MSKFTIKDLEAPGWQMLLSLTATWPAVRLGGDLFGDFRSAVKTMRLRTVLEGLRLQMMTAKPEFVAGVKLVVLNHMPGQREDQLGAALLAASENGRRLAAGVAQTIGAEFTQALDALQAEVYQRAVNMDLVDELRTTQRKRPAWMVAEHAIDASRAALVRAGRRQTLWRRVRDGAPALFDIPSVQPTESVSVGTVTLEGSITAINDRSRRLTVQGACKASPVIKRLGITSRSFPCEVEDVALYTGIRALPPNKPLTLEINVKDSVVHAGELRRTYHVTSTTGM